MQLRSLMIHTMVTYWDAACIIGSLISHLPYKYDSINAVIIS